MIYVDSYSSLYFIFSHLLSFVFKKVALVQGRSINHSMNRIVISHLKYFCLQTENKWQVCSLLTAQFWGEAPGSWRCCSPECREVWKFLQTFNDWSLKSIQLKVQQSSRLSKLLCNFSPKLRLFNHSWGGGGGCMKYKLGFLSTILSQIGFLSEMKCKFYFSEVQMKNRKIVPI